MNDQFLNEKLLELLEKHKLGRAELARRIEVAPSAISHICSGRKNLGPKLFIKILEKGFGFSKMETKQIFLKAMEAKYF